MQGIVHPHRIPRKSVGEEYAIFGQLYTVASATILTLIFAVTSVCNNRVIDLYYGQSLSQFRTWFVTKEELLRDGLKRQTLVVVPSRKLEQFYREMQPIRFSSPLKRLRRAVVVGGG